MLKFDKIRNISQKMKTESFTYAEHFLQKVFDSIDSHENSPFFDMWDINSSSFPEGADPCRKLEAIRFSFTYDVSGLLIISFLNSNLQNTPSWEFLPIQEVLLNNGFIKEENTYEITFTRAI